MYFIVLFLKIILMLYKVGVNMITVPRYERFILELLCYDAPFQYVKRIYSRITEEEVETWKFFFLSKEKLNTRQQAKPN